MSQNNNEESTVTIYNTIDIKFLLYKGRLTLWKGISKSIKLSFYVSFFETIIYLCWWPTGKWQCFISFWLNCYCFLRVWRIYKVDRIEKENGEYYKRQRADKRADKQNNAKKCTMDKFLHWIENDFRDCYLISFGFSQK